MAKLVDIQGRFPCEPDSSGLYGAVEKAADQIWLELDLSVFADHEADRRKAAEKDHGGASPTGR